MTPAIPTGAAEINLGALIVLQAKTLQEYSRGISLYYFSIAVARERNQPSDAKFICWAASLLIQTIKESEKTRENKTALYILNSQQNNISSSNTSHTKIHWIPVSHSSAVAAKTDITKMQTAFSCWLHYSCTFLPNCSSLALYGKTITPKEWVLGKQKVLSKLIFQI